MASPPLAAVRATAAAIVLQVLALAATVARVIARRKGELNLGADDYALFISLVGSVGTTAVTVDTALKGWLFVPPTTIELDNPEGNSLYRQHQFALNFLSAIFLSIVKISVVLFYKRIFKTKKFILAANLSIAAIAIAPIVINVLALISNDPISAYWTVQFNKVPIQRILMNNIILAYSVICVVLDLLVLILPLPAIRNLQMSRRRKIYITGIFLVATICLIGSILRLYYFQSYVRLRERLGRAEQAPADALSNYFLWAQYEMCIAIIASCLLTLRPLFRRRKKKQITPLSEEGQQHGAYRIPSSSNKSHDDSWNGEHGLGAKGVPMAAVGLKSPRREWFEAHLDEAGVEVDITAAADGDDGDGVLPKNNEEIVVRKSITTRERFR